MEGGGEVEVDEPQRVKGSITMGVEIKVKVINLKR